MVAASLSFADCSAAVVEKFVEDSYPATRSRFGTYITLLVAGAIRRQLRKRYGSDAIHLLSPEIVNQAFWAEFARAISEWPGTVDFIRPSEFVSTALGLWRAFADLGWCKPPALSTALIYPHILDDRSLCVAVWNSDSQIVFAGPNCLRFFSLCSDEQFHRITRNQDFIDETDRDRFMRDFEYFASGHSLQNVKYRLAYPMPQIEVTVRLATQVYDDDNAYIGHMWVFEPTPAQSPLRKMAGWVTESSARLVSTAASLALLSKAFHRVMVDSQLHQALSIISVHVRA